MEAHVFNVAEEPVQTPEEIAIRDEKKRFYAAIRAENEAKRAAKRAAKRTPEFIAFIEEKKRIAAAKRAANLAVAHLSLATTNYHALYERQEIITCEADLKAIRELVTRHKNRLIAQERPDLFMSLIIDGMSQDHCCLPYY